MFDFDESGNCDVREMTNLMAIMCGGTIQDKINSAFIMFDADNSGTMA
jgi:Ca2+-binding EF-hand superfamily protein